MTLSEKMLSLTPSLTLTLNEKARSLKASGVDVIALSSGESSLRPPLCAREAAHKAVDTQRFYTAVEGSYELRSSIADYLWRHNQLSYPIGDIIASTGCKQSLFNMLYVLLNAGDEVLIPTPYWTSYPQMAQACQGVPVFIPSAAESRYLPTAESLREAITPRSKVLILNSPNNPTSQSFTRQELEALAGILVHYPDLWICCDDIYDQLYLNERPPHLLEVAPELKERTVVINGVSKSHAMSGWRLGFAAGPSSLIKGMKTLQSQSTSNTCVIAQAAAIAALREADPQLQEARDFYTEQHVLLSHELSHHIPLLPLLPPQGGLYQWLDLRAFIKSGGWKNDTDFAEDLISDQHVSLIPGSAFGQEGFARVSVTEPADRLKESVQRLTDFLNKRHAL